MTFGRDGLEREGERTGPQVPFGALGVASVMAGILGLLGLLLPTTMLEAASFQLYLDKLVPSAMPPFGWAAHVAAGLALALLGGLLGWVLARLFRVQPDQFNLRRLVNRLRGIGREDDADAPYLRAADRHPDAPARRPFSAASDIPWRDQGDHWAHFDDEDDDEAELLLDASFADAPLESLAPIEPPAPLFPHQPALIFDDAAKIDAGKVDAGKIVVDPIDLSVGKLDDLLARLAAGLAKRAAVAAPHIRPPATTMSGAEQSAAAQTFAVPPAAAAPDVQDTTFPQDPALAAALATLRRMNQHVG